MEMLKFRREKARVFLLIMLHCRIARRPEFFPPKAEKPAGPREKVAIGVGSFLLSAPIIIAREKGFIADEGLDMTFKQYSFGKKAMEAMFAGEVDIATVAETPIVFNSFIRDDFIVFATFVYSYNDSKVLGRKDQGVSKPEDLKGKKLGITAKTSTHFFAHIYLAEHGMEENAAASIWDDYVFKLSLEQSLLTTLEDQARWTIKNGFTEKTKVPNYLGYLYLDALKGIGPEAVTIIK